jgi:hypothetical protein
VEDETGTAGSWRIRAYAICADPPPGLELITATSPFESDPASVKASCPSGKNLLGAAGEITSGFGEVVMDDLRPDAALTSVTVLGLEDQNGTSSNWNLTAYAICANP